MGGWDWGTRELHGSQSWWTVATCRASKLALRRRAHVIAWCWTWKVASGPLVVAQVGDWDSPTGTAVAMRMCPLWFPVLAAPLMDSRCDGSLPELPIAQQSTSLADFGCGVMHEGIRWAPLMAAIVQRRLPCAGLIRLHMARVSVLRMTRRCKLRF